ncbi:hypothetical protein BGY98DRAFT_983253 [Russula aff. rugulosa BPL654]|nr:hypothetical protein BGY98DRAFT_983253 [Russula aff. rugulosa BPL654]
MQHLFVSAGIRWRTLRVHQKCRRADIFPFERGITSRTSTRSGALSGVIPRISWGRFVP